MEVVCFGLWIDAMKGSCCQWSSLDDHTRHLPENSHFLDTTTGSDLLIHHLLIFCMSSFSGVDSVSWGVEQPHVFTPINSSGPLPPCSKYPQDRVTVEAPSWLLKVTLSQASRALQLSLKGTENSEFPCICCCYHVIRLCCLHCPMRNSLGLALRMCTWARMCTKCICWEK